MLKSATDFVLDGGVSKVTAIGLKSLLDLEKIVKKILFSIEIMSTVFQLGVSFFKDQACK